MNQTPSFRSLAYSLGKVIALTIALLFFAPNHLRAADAKADSEVVDFSKLIPLLPDAPAGWTAEKPQGTTTDAAGFKMTNVHREYTKGEGGDASSVTLSILDASANREYMDAITGTWSMTSSSTEGYAKGVQLDGNAGYETFENEGKHGTLWVIVGKRFLVEIESHNVDPKELQEWAKRIDLKKLADMK
jgi:hypothetical protein